MWAIAHSLSLSLSLSPSLSLSLSLKRFAFSLDQKLYDLADIDEDGRVSLHEFLAAFQPHDRSLAGGVQAGAGGKASKVREPADVQNEERLGELRSKLKVVHDSAERELSSATDKEARAGANDAANKLRAKFSQAAGAAQSKIDAAEKALRTNKLVIDNPQADAKALKKAHKGVTDASKDVAAARQQLEAAQRQHDEAVDLIFRALEQEEDSLTASYREVAARARFRPRAQKSVCHLLRFRSLPPARAPGRVPRRLTRSPRSRRSSARQRPAPVVSASCEAERRGSMVPI